MKFLALIITTVWMNILVGLGQVTIVVNGIPENTPDNATLYIAGNFNNWDPGDSESILEKQTDNTYIITLGSGSGTLEYKFTRGDWDTVESDANGNDIGNRTFSYGNGETVNVQILSWKDLETSSGEGGTAAENVSILSAGFFMPQLNRSRRIWIYLPLDYESSTESYPVIYMHDAQNLFNNATSFAGEWKVDEALNSLSEIGATKSIVVGIDNGGSLRIDELTPWSNSQYGGGDGDKYIRFISETLKPHIDANYRTLPDRENTGIMGSSLGGLISYYAGIKYPETFGIIGAFSPSFWYSDEIFPFTKAYQNEYDSKFFFLMGGKESENAIPDMNAVIDELKSTGFPENNIKAIIKDDGQHSEWFWTREFPDAYLWLVGDEDLITSINNEDSSQSITLYPNPANAVLYVKLDNSIRLKTKLTVHNIWGEKLEEYSLDTLSYIDNKVSLDVSKWNNGYYFFQFSTGSAIYNKTIYVGN